MMLSSSGLLFLKNDLFDGAGCLDQAAIVAGSFRVNSYMVRPLGPSAYWGGYRIELLYGTLPQQSFLEGSFKVNHYMAHSLRGAYQWGLSEWTTTWHVPSAELTNSNGRASGIALIKVSAGILPAYEMWANAGSYRSEDPILHRAKRKCPPQSLSPSPPSPKLRPPEWENPSH